MPYGQEKVTFKASCLNSFCEIRALVDLRPVFSRAGASVAVPEGISSTGFPDGHTCGVAHVCPLPWAFAPCPSFVNTGGLRGEILARGSAASELQLSLKVTRLLKHNKVDSLSPPVPTGFPWGCV